MSTTRAKLTTIAVVLPLALLAACDSEATPPPPSTTSTSASPTTTTTTFTPPAGVPRVANPLDGSAFEQAPCTSLTPAQRKQLGLDDGRPGTGDNPDQSEDSCTYFDHDPATELIVYVNYYLEDVDGLSDRYKYQRNGSYPRWEPTNVDGYPAVVFHSNIGEPADCNLDVGINDTTVFGVKVFYYRWKGWTGQDPCVQARSIASAVLATIKAAN